MNAKFSKIGFILAVAGSAVGLGNAWKFPTMVGQNGGIGFILLYLLLTLIVGLVIFLAELSIGKLSEKDPVNAYKTLAPSYKNLWGFAGFSMIGAILIVSFYSLVIGWIVKYTLISFSSLPDDIKQSGELFQNFMSEDFTSQFFCFLFVFILMFYIVSKGIKNGIERLNVWLMPILFILLLFMLLYSMSFSGFEKAYHFLIFPELSTIKELGFFEAVFGKINENSVLSALGLAFFSLSLGVGTIITYSASLPDKTNFIQASLVIIFINILIGIMMGFVVFTYVFEFGGEVSQGPGLIFVSLTTLFSNLGSFGNVLAVCFFISLFFAGITSAVSMIEPFALYLINTYNFTRKKALTYIAIVVFVLGVLCILSFMSFTNGSLIFFGSKSVFDILDYLSSNIIMPIGGFCAAIFVGFIMKKEGLKILFSPYMNDFFFSLWYFFLRYISPLAIIIVVINQIYPQLFAYIFAYLKALFIFS